MDPRDSHPARGSWRPGRGHRAASLEPRAVNSHGTWWPRDHKRTPSPSRRGGASGSPALNYPRPKPPPDSSAPRRGRRSRRALGWSQVLGGEPGAEGYIYAKVPRLTPKKPRAEGGQGWGTGGLSVGDAKGSGRKQGTERWLVTAARASSPGGGDPPAQDERGTCSSLPPAASRGLRRLSAERGP